MIRLKLLGAVALLGVLACEEATPPPPVGSITGQVAIEGTGIDGVSVNLSNGNSTTTSGGGNYRFDNVEGGAYTVTISGYPSDATFDATSAAATISSAGQSVTVNFSGAYIRTASVMGSVTVENMGLGGVTVALSGMSSATAVTDDSGQYAFTGLRMGSYSVEITGFDSDEVGFSNTSAAVTVAVGESKIVSFDGTYLRTAGIMGRVSVEGEGLADVTVSLSGGPDGVDETTMTDAAGQYSFARLRAGDYQVGISGYDTDDYEFEVTSQNVTVALGETANVPFEGVLLRTAGVSGRVSVEGIGLEDVMVTLSAMDMDDMTAMTDAGGLYAFAGLASGDYTVAIALSEEQMAAYVFESTSMDVTLEDDMTEIVNFAAEHAATASVTVKLFVDEGANGRNDVMDDGEGAFPTAEMLAMVAELGLPLALPISLAGPGVHDMQSGMAMPDGSVVFANLKAGQYQVLVSDIPADVLAALPPALGAILQDYAYGGPATGYPIALTVGQEAMQYAPVDITHTTVHFGVTLKNGEMRGMPLPGAMVTLYADEDGEDKVGEGMTMVNEETMHAAASIRVARDGTSGNMVYAGVSADSAYTVAEGMTAVMWDPQMTHTMGANDNDIVNLSVDVTFGGATITTEYGGGDELAGWAVSVAHGDTMYADTLDADGMAEFKMTVDSASALPAMYTFSVDTIQDNDLDGGEKFEADEIEYVHTGLALAGTMDAGTLEVKYTTQTLRVYVHHERDQVMGYTGNVLGGDVRASGMLGIDLRYIDDAGRSRPFQPTVWRRTTTNPSDNKGVVTFRGVPTDYDVIVKANKADADDNIEVLDPDELAAYRNIEENGVTGGAFGAMGGFSHTVELCALMRTDPEGQDHGECASFAYVSTWEVSGLVWKRTVTMNPATDGFRAVVDPDTINAGVSVDLEPVDGKNLAGEDESFTTVEKNSRGKRDTHRFDFGAIAAGVYKLTVSDGWRARLGEKDTEEMLEKALNPLAADIALDVTPATGTLYGRVTGADGFAVEDATVNVNGQEATTDARGRYIVEGFSAVRGGSRSPTRPRYRNKLLAVVTVSKDGVMTKTDTLFWNDKAGQAAAEAAAEDEDDDFTYTDMWDSHGTSGTPVNNPTEYPIAVSAVVDKVTITGQVTDILTGDGIARVEIKVDGAVPLNPAKSGRDRGRAVTDSDGNYEAEIRTKARGMTAAVSVSRTGYHFPVPSSPVLADGNSPAVVNFQGYENGTIKGTVQDPTGRAMAGVSVTARSTAAGSETLPAHDSTTTNSVGQFSLSVAPVSTYMIAASMGNHTFDYPNDNQTIFAGPGQTVSFGRIKAKTAGALNVTAVRERVPDDEGTPDADESMPTRWGTTILVNYDADPDNMPEGYNAPTYTIQTNTGTDGAWADGGSPTAVNDAQGNPIPGRFTITTPAAANGGDGEFMVRVVTAADETTPSTPPAPFADTSATATVAAVDPSATGVAARRQAAADSDAPDATGNFIQASWSAVTNANSDFRVVAQIAPASLGGVMTWVVLAGPTSGDGSERELVSADISGITTLSAAIAGGTGSTVTVTEAELAAAIKIAVEWVQGDPGADNEWKRSAEVDLSERESS